MKLGVHPLLSSKYSLDSLNIWLTQDLTPAMLPETFYCFPKRPLHTPETIAIAQLRRLCHPEIPGQGYNNFVNKRKERKGCLLQFGPYDHHLL